VKIPFIILNLSFLKKPFNQQNQEEPGFKVEKPCRLRGFYSLLANVAGLAENNSI